MPTQMSVSILREKFTDVRSYIQKYAKTLQLFTKSFKYFQFFLTASYDEISDGKRLGLQETAREWKLFMFPISENFYHQIIGSPESVNNMVPQSSILARWQLPIQVLSETRDPKKLVKNKRKNSPTDDWAEPQRKKPKISAQKQEFIDLLLQSEIDDFKIAEMKQFLVNQRRESAKSGE